MCFLKVMGYIVWVYKSETVICDNGIKAYNNVLMFGDGICLLYIVKEMRRLLDQHDPIWLIFFLE